MKDCKDCENFGGWDYSDGTPNCDCDGGYESCPYNDMASTKNDGVKIEIDADFMGEYIRNTLMNTVHSVAYNIAATEIKSIITDELKQNIRSKIDECLERKIEDVINEFMAKPIIINQGWCEPAREITREQYISEILDKQLSDKMTTDKMNSLIKSDVDSAISNFSRKLRDDINRGIKTKFDETTRATLTDNVVSMLMCSETYKSLSDGMNRLLK